jgi:asparagine N-glycosylation enzyme membrane subunit Stt3
MIVIMLLSFQNYSFIIIIIIMIMILLLLLKYILKNKIIDFLTRNTIYISLNHACIVK